MVDQLTPEIDSEKIETDIRAIAEEMEKHREAPETRHLTSRELLRHSIRSYTGVQPQPAAPPPAGQAASAVLPDYAQTAAPEAKLEIESLLGLAFREGVLKATDEAAKSSPFVTDAFHDALAGKLYEELKKRGLVKE